MFNWCLSLTACCFSILIGTAPNLATCNSDKLLKPAGVWLFTCNAADTLLCKSVGSLALVKASLIKPSNLMTAWLPLDEFLLAFRCGLTKLI